LRDLPRDELLLDLQIAVLAAQDVDRVLSGLEVGRDKCSIRSGDDVPDELVLLVEDLNSDGAGSAVVLREEHGAGEPTCRHLLGRLLELEHVPVTDASCDRLPVFACRLEDELARSRERGRIEGLPCRSGHAGFGDQTILPHHHVKLYDRFDWLLAIGLGVGGLDEADEFRWRD
jgi:hypothetical protein